MFSRSQTRRVIATISRHGFAPSSSASNSPSGWPVCCSSHASSATFGTTRSAPSLRHSSDADGDAPLLTLTESEMNASGASTRRVVAPLGGRLSNGKPIWSTWTPVSFS